MSYAEENQNYNGHPWLTKTAQESPMARAAAILASFRIEPQDDPRASVTANWDESN